MKTNKKTISVRGYVRRSLLQSFFYFVMLAGFENIVFIDNKEAIGNNVFGLLFLMGAVILWFMSYFEIRTVTKNEERFLGYKGYILFFIKLLLFFAVVLTAISGAKTTDSVIVFNLLICVWPIVYFTISTTVFAKYRNNVKRGTGEIYICYGLRIKKWYIEGTVD